MDATRFLVTFTLADKLYALPLEVVDRVVRVVAITCLPDTPAMMRGVINVQGHVLPVLELRPRLRLPQRDIELSDRLIIARVDDRRVALLVDAVHGVMTVPTDHVMAAETVVPSMANAEGVVKLPDGMLLLVQGLEAFLELRDLPIPGSFPPIARDDVQ